MKRFFILSLAICWCAYAQGKDSRPNILVLLADQWRAQAFGYAGDPNVKTPNIDTLAHESVNLKNAVANLPVCCPTRASLFTGQRPLTHGVFLNDVPLRNESITTAEVLQSAGYDTGYVGKWHLNGDGHRAGFIPRERRQGFDYWKVLECTHDYNRSFYYGDTPEKRLWEGYDAIAQTRDVQQYLREPARHKRPFFFILAWGPPHEPYQTAPEKYRAMYDPARLDLRGNVPKESEQNARRDLAGYYAHCTALDDCLGNLRQTLRETGLDENTIVIFSADHGDMLGSHGFHKKQRPWDESIRVPLLFHWPKGLGQNGRTLDAPFSSEDFSPTLLGLCKIKAPKSMEGINFASYLAGGKNPSDNTAVILSIAPFSDWGHLHGGKEFRGLRTSRYTYVRDLNGPWLLYDNEVDPLQMTNLINSSGVKGIQSNLDDWLRRKLKQRHDDFQPAKAYLQKWGYKTDRNGTVPYTQ